MKIKVAQLQLKVFEEKEKNIEQLHQVLEKLRKEKVDLVTVGEMFTCPYRTENFPVYAERRAVTAGRRSAPLQKNIMFIFLWDPLQRWMKMVVYTIQHMCLTVTEDKLQSTERYICLISRLKAGSALKNRIP